MTGKNKHCELSKNDILIPEQAVNQLLGANSPHAAFLYLALHHSRSPLAHGELRTQLGWSSETYLQAETILQELGLMPSAQEQKKEDAISTLVTLAEQKLGIGLVHQPL